jgi:Big-like domain-containing protein
VPNPTPTPTPTRDRTAPSITLTTPANGASYTRNSTLVAKYTCADAGSGIKSCTGSVPNGATISTRNRGMYLFTVTAVDKSGNRAVKMVYFTVR